jgi:hypothetical protein
MGIRSTVIATLTAALAWLTIGGQAMAQQASTAAPAAVGSATSVRAASLTPSFAQRIGRDGWDVRLAVLEPRGGGGTGVRSLLVGWGDGTTTRKALRPELRYASIGLLHHYPVQARTFFITITVTDANGAQAVHGPFAILPLFKVTFGPMEFGPIHDDCDQTIFTGKGDFSVRYWYDWDNGSYRVQNEGEVRFDLNVNETHTLFPNGITFHDVTAINYPVVKWSWTERDIFLNPKFDPTLIFSDAKPSLGSHTSDWYYSTEAGCDVRFRITRTTVLEQ